MSNKSNPVSLLPHLVRTYIYMTLAGPCIIIQFKQINQLNATVSQVYYLMFMCGSTCFGRLPGHYQELKTALTDSDFTLERGGSSVVGRGLAGYVSGCLNYLN
jgi:hypothetical protein